MRKRIGGHVGLATPTLLQQINGASPLRADADSSDREGRSDYRVLDLRSHNGSSVIGVNKRMASNLITKSTPNLPLSGMLRNQGARQYQDSYN